MGGFSTSFEGNNANIPDFDGGLDKSLGSFNTTFRGGTPRGWPVNGKHAQAGVNVAGMEANLTSEPFATWNKKKDFIIIQGRYPFSGYVQTIYTAITDFKQFNSGHKAVLYTNAWKGDGNSPPATEQRERLTTDAWTNNGSPASWVQYDTSGTVVTYDQGDFDQRINPYATVHSAGSRDATFDQAIAQEYEDTCGGGGPANILQLLDGWFEDSTDYQDTFGGGGYTTDPNYLDNGLSSGQDPTYYRQGVVTNFDVRRQTGVWPSNAAAVTNGGRDNTAVNRDILDSDFDWDGAFDARLSENATGGSKLGLTSKDQSNEMEIIRAPGNAIRDLMRSILISELMVDTSSNNKLGKGVVIMDAVFSFPEVGVNRYWVGPGPTEALIPQGMWEAARFYCGISMLHDSILFSASIGRGVDPFPYMDELVYDCGEPLGGAPVLATMDDTTTSFTTTLRAADNNGFYWQEYENVLWVCNFNDPAQGDYPQAATDVCTLPSAGVGFEWRHADGTYTNTSRTTGATQARSQSPSVNDGSLPDGTGTTLTIPRWHARMLVRTPT
jgi:hypothetical protein